MNKAYSRIIWQNQPSTATALGATNLNKMDSAINTIDDRVVSMDTAKAEQSTVNELVKSITYNESNGVITITKQNGTSTTIDTKLEKLAVNFTYNSTTQKLIITLDDKTTQEVDLSSLISQYEFINTSTVAFVIEDGKVKANIVNGSITADKLQPNYLADITVQAQTATAQAKKAQRYAVGGVETGDTTDNAKYYKEQAELFKNQAKTFRDEAEDISGVGVAAENKLGLVKGNGNVSVREDGAMWSDPYKDKATGMTGTFITCPTSDDALVHVTKIEGETVQKVTVTGKNIYDQSQLKPFTVNGITMTIVNGEMILNGTATANMDIYIMTASTVSYNPNASKVLKEVQQLPSNVALSNSLGLENYFYDGTNFVKNTMLASSVRSAFIRIPNGKVCTNLKLTIQLEIGTVATPYEPHTPNSPSPDYPSPLIYAKDFDITTSGYNLLTDNMATQTINGVTFTVNEDKSVTVNGTATGDTQFNIYQNPNIPYLPNKTYYLSGCPSGGSTTTYYLRVSDITSTSATDIGNGILCNVSPKHIFIRVFSGITMNNVVFKPQLEVGTVKTLYQVPVKDKKTISFPFMGLPNGVRNTIEIINGKLTKVERVKELILNGTENWSKSGSTAVDRYNYNLISIGTKASSHPLLTHFLGVNKDVTTIGSATIQGNTTLVINYAQYETTTLEQWKAFLVAQHSKGTPLTVQYELATPIYTPIDDICLKSWFGTTHLFTNSNPQVTLTADFKSELWSNEYLMNKAIENVELPDNVVYFGQQPIVTSPTPRDADLLGGKDKAYFEGLVTALASSTSMSISNIQSLLNGSGVSDVNSIEGFKVFGVSSTTLNMPRPFDGLGIQFTHSIYTSQILLALGTNELFHRTKYGTWRGWVSYSETAVSYVKDSGVNTSTNYSYRQNGRLYIDVRVTFTDDFANNTTKVIGTMGYAPPISACTIYGRNSTTNQPLAGWISTNGSFSIRNTTGTTIVAGTEVCVLCDIKHA